MLDVVTRPRVAALGQATTEFFGGLLRLPDDATGVRMSEVSVQVGGAAATAAAAAVALGCAATYCGKLCDDFLGRHAIEALRGAGIDTSLVVVGGGSMSPFSFTAIGREDQRRIGFHTDGDVSPMRADEVPIAALLSEAAALLLDGSSPAAQVASAEAARARNLPVVLDIGELREGVGELIGVADVLLSSERLASEIAPRGELQDSLIELQKLGPRAVIITIGDSGSIGLHGDQLVRQPALPVRVVDTTGAGYVYHGAFAAALVQGQPFARCMELASIAASLRCRKLGAMAGVPSVEDVREHLSYSP
jgi:sugar/nucleoside kinase (ribokinase family)